MWFRYICKFDKYTLYEFAELMNTTCTRLMPFQVCLLLSRLFSFYTFSAIKCSNFGIFCKNCHFWKFHIPRPTCHFWQLGIPSIVKNVKNCETSKLPDFPCSPTIWNNKCLWKHERFIKTCHDALLLPVYFFLNKYRSPDLPPEPVETRNRLRAGT